MFVDSFMGVFAFHLKDETFIWGAKLSSLCFLRPSKSLGFGSVAVVGVGSVLGLFVCLSVYVQPFLSCDAPKIIAKILAGGCRAILEIKLGYARLKRKNI